MRAVPLGTARLTLEPLTGENAERLAVDLVPVLAEPSLYRFIGGRPPTEPELVERHLRWGAGASPDGRDWWLNWAVRRAADQVAVGTMQATASRGAGGGATVAWVVGRQFQGSGYAAEAAAAVLAWLRSAGTPEVVAWIHPGNAASQAVAVRLGMTRNGTVLDGEEGWAVAQAR